MQRDKEKREKVPREEPYVFQDCLPEEILQELTPEIRRQYFLWDEIAKREVQMYPWIVLPLIEEVFHRKYPENVEIKLLSTEYAVKRIHKDGEKTLQSVYSDLLLRVGSELYHLECQMEENREMAIRMLEYDVHIALTHGAFPNGKKGMESGCYEVHFPQSVILYLGSAKNTPDFETCTIHFRENEIYEYKVPVLKVQEYSPGLIGEKHLDMLIPFLPIRFRKAVKSPSGNVREKARKNLTELLAECIMILKQEKENGMLTESAGNDIAEYLSCACDHLFAGDLGLIKEVHEIMEPAVKLRREIVQELQEDIRDLQENNRDLQEKLSGLEKGLERFIRKSQLEGKSREETGRALQDFFALSAEEAGEKLGQHWKA